MKLTDFAERLEHFLTKYLPGQRNVSANTIRSYRDTFVLLLRYLRDIKIKSIERISIKEITPEIVIEFLDYLEGERGVKARTRNQRLAAIHSFFRYLQVEEPERVMQCQRILAIPFKRYSKRSIEYLTAELLEEILSQPDLSTHQGRRDALLLSVLYDTGGRVQELIDLSVRDVRLEPPAQVRLMGKGGKERIVPLMESTAKALKHYMLEQKMLNVSYRFDKPLFCNRLGARLTRSGIRYILSKYVQLANRKHPNLTERTTPHTLRHTKAMHMLQSGVPLVTIRDFLGHTDIKTSEVYARADLDMKRRALEKASNSLPTLKYPSWCDDKNLLQWLQSL